MTVQNWHDLAGVGVWGVLSVAVLAGGILRERIREIRAAREQDARDAASDAEFMAYWADAR